MGEQYKIKYDDSLKCWVIIDTTTNVQGLTGYETRVEAEARVHELNASTMQPSSTTKEARAKRFALIMSNLKGKVKCSQCLTAFHETDAALRVTRLIGPNSKNLVVDLRCLVCQHHGIFTFDGNPLIDAGLAKLECL